MHGSGTGGATIITSLEPWDIMGELGKKYLGGLGLLGPDLRKYLLDRYKDEAVVDAALKAYGFFIGADPCGGILVSNHSNTFVVVIE